jgi:enoyl-CoA hydratase/carnithine racemase
VPAEPAVHRRVEARAGGRVAYLTIDHPGKLNVLNTSLLERLVAAFEAFGGDEELRVVVLTGAGERAFIGGADIRELAQFTPATARDFITLLHRACAAVRRLPVPVIARIRGFALGGGLEVAAACDLRVASEDARFGMPEVRVGIPSVIEAALLPLLIGWGRTRRLVLTGETIGAVTAERWGLVERCVPVGELDAAVEAWVAAILACGPRAMRAQKALVTAWESLPLADAIERGIDSLAQAYEADEPRRMMAAFLEAAAQRKRG